MSDCPVFRKRSKADAFMRERIERRFSDVWKARNSIRPAIAVDSMEDWAKGRKHYLTFLIRVREEKLIEKIADIQDRLSTIPCVDPFPEEY
ncbi:MAG: hypothetical protein JSV58_00260, partial [Candidatus Bathyarchaeota archaeon]